MANGRVIGMTVTKEAFLSCVTPAGNEYFISPILVLPPSSPDCVAVRHAASGQEAQLSIGLRGFTFDNTVIRAPGLLTGSAPSP
jgi:hypothetical protein